MDLIQEGMKKLRSAVDEGLETKAPAEMLKALAALSGGVLPEAVFADPRHTASKSTVDLSVYALSAGNLLVVTSAHDKPDSTIRRRTWRGALCRCGA